MSEVFEKDDILVLNNDVLPFWLDSDINEEQATEYNLNTIGVTVESKLKILDIVNAFNSDKTNWSTYLIVKDLDQDITSSIEVGWASQNLVKLNDPNVETYNDIEEYKEEIQEINSKETNDIVPETPFKEMDNNLLEFLAKKYGLDIEKEKANLELERKVEKVMKELQPSIELYLGNIDHCYGDDNCIYCRISDKLNNDISCNVLRILDLLVNKRDLSEE